MSYSVDYRPLNFTRLLAVSPGEESKRLSSGAWLVLVQGLQSYGRQSSYST